MHTYLAEESGVGELSKSVEDLAALLRRHHYPDVQAVLVCMCVCGMCTCVSVRSCERPLHPHKTAEMRSSEDMTPVHTITHSREHAHACTHTQDTRTHHYTFTRACTCTHTYSGHPYTPLHIHASMHMHAHTLRTPVHTITHSREHAHARTHTQDTRTHHYTFTRACPCTHTYPLGAPCPLRSSPSLSCAQILPPRFRL